RGYRDAITLGTTAAIIPMLVIPDGTLWTVQFDHEGRKQSDPQNVQRCSFFVDRSIRAGDPTITFHVSHLEIVTLSGMVDFIRQYSGHGIGDLFPDAGLAVPKE